MKNLILILAFTLLGLNCFSQRKVVKVESQVQDVVVQNEERVLKRKVAIARFSNETQYAKGIFYDKNNDPIAKQAVDILSTKLAASNKFILLERQDIEKVYEELKIAGNEGIQKLELIT